MLKNPAEKKNSFFIYKPQETQHGCLDTLLLFLLLTGIILIPFIPLSSSFFFSIEELIVVLIGARLFQKCFFWLDWYLLIILFFAVFVLFVILINPNKAHLTEYFEIYKILKYGTIYTFSIYYFSTSKHLKKVNEFIIISFLILVVFNLLHYFDVFNFNKNVTILYDSDGRDVQFFGLNSLGLPGPKRMIGTMGNPNDNSILFLFYFVYFQSISSEVKKKKITIYKIFYFIAFLMIVMCQSRTGLIAALFVFCTGFLLRNKKEEKIIKYLFDLIIFTLLIVLLFVFEKNSGVNYLGNTNIIEFDENASVRGRFEVWSYLLEMWSQKPLFGYGPNKEFMYANSIYPENEYIFYLWRFGIIGLVFYLLLMFFPAIKFLKNKPENRLLIYTTILISVVALTNNPYSNPKFLIIIALIVGYCVSLYYRKQIVKDE